MDLELCVIEEMLMVIYIQDLNGNWLNVWVGMVIEHRYSINIFVCKNS